MKRLGHAAAFVAVGLSSACTLFWPIEDHALQVTSADATTNDDGDLSDGAVDGLVTSDSALESSAPSNVATVANVGAGPKLLALSNVYAFVIAQDEKVTRVDKTTGAVEALVTPATGYAGQPFTMSGLAADSQWIFLSGNENAGCGAPANVWKRSVTDAGVWNLLAGGECPRYATLSLDSIDVAVALENTNTNTTTLFLQAVNGGGMRTLASGLPLTSALAARADELYIASGPTRRIVRVPKVEDAGIDIATTQGTPSDIVADNDNVYWIEVEGRLASKPRKAGASDVAKELAMDGLGPYTLAQDATRLYWANVDSGAIRTVLKTGGAVETIASGQAQPADIAADESGVYWINRGDGSLMRASK